MKCKVCGSKVNDMKKHCYDNFQSHAAYANQVLRLCIYKAGYSADGVPFHLIPVTVVDDDDWFVAY